LIYHLTVEKLPWAINFNLKLELLKFIPFN